MWYWYRGNQESVHHKSEDLEGLLFTIENQYLGIEERVSFKFCIMDMHCYLNLTEDLCIRILIVSYFITRYLHRNLRVRRTPDGSNKGLWIQ